MFTREKTDLLREFERQFPTEEVCASFVREYLAEEGLLRCHYCASTQVEHTKGRTVRCIDCRKKSWFTSGTTLHGAKKLKPFLAVLWFDQHGHPINSSEGHVHLDVAQSSAWNMIKKIEIAHEDEQDLDETKVVVLSCEAFTATINKRSRETPANKHPRDEIQLLDSNIAQAQSPPSLQERILDVLTNAANAIHIDTLSQLTETAPSELWLQLRFLELDNRIKSEGGDRFKINRKHPAFSLRQSHSVPLKVLTKRVADFLAFIQRNFHGTSRKYLQLYLCKFGRVLSEDRISWDALVRRMIKHGPISDAEIRGYSSPRAVCLLI